jgi:hypothetical protein
MVLNRVTNYAAWFCRYEKYFIDTPIPVLLCHRLCR